MSLLFEQVYNPDILNCLANLSNDEVFTPPEVVNNMLDMLPQELFQSPNTTFLDPACKTGVFLREIAKRLLEGLQDVIPDEEDRRHHIFTKQLFGIAITEMTSLLSRRSLYCSKYANTIYSIVPFNDVDGNIRFKNIKHYWEGNKCGFCGAGKLLFDRDQELEQHAYEFIHTNKPKEIWGMTFDVIIGNPPYQISDGGFGDSSKPLYHQFVTQAIKLSPRFLTMVIPARWYAGGKGLNDFRKEMLNDKRIMELHDFPETADCFPGVNIRGGVCYFLWGRDYHGDCSVINYKDGKPSSTALRPLVQKGEETFIRYNEAMNILHKVQAFREPTMEEQVSSRKPFGLATNFSDYSEQASKQKSILLYRFGSRGYISKGDVHKSVELIDEHKVLVAKASPGSDDYPHLVFSEPIVAKPGSACTETYLVVSVVKSPKEGLNLKRYMSTSFFRFLVLLMKNTQDVPKRVYRYVPVQDLSVEWSDELLFKKYGISKNEQAFISTLIKPVEWGNSNE